MLSENEILTLINEDKQSTLRHFCSYYHLGISIPEYCLINMETYYNINAVHNEKADFCLKVTIVTKKLQKPWLLLP